MHVFAYLHTGRHNEAYHKLTPGGEAVFSFDELDFFGFGLYADTQSCQQYSV